MRKDYFIYLLKDVKKPEVKAAVPKAHHESESVGFKELQQRTTNLHVGVTQLQVLTYSTKNKNVKDLT